MPIIQDFRKIRGVFWEVILQGMYCCVPLRNRSGSPSALAGLLLSMHPVVPPTPSHAHQLAHLSSQFCSWLDHTLPLLA